MHGPKEAIVFVAKQNGNLYRIGPYIKTVSLFRGAHSLDPKTREIRQLRN